MLRFTRVESTTQDVLMVIPALSALEGYLFLDPPSDDLAVELILRPIVQVHGASLRINEVTHHFNQRGQVKFELSIARYVFHYIKKGDCILDGTSRFHVEVIFLGTCPHDVRHKGYHAFLHQLSVEDLNEQVRVYEIEELRIVLHQEMLEIGH